MNICVKVGQPPATSVSACPNIHLLIGCSMMHVYTCPHYRQDGYIEQSRKGLLLVLLQYVRVKNK